MKIQIDKEVKTPKQYSKKWLTLNTCMAWLWISAYLATDIIANKAEHINNIIVLLVTSIIGTIIPYYCKSYLETKEDKRIQLEQMKLQNQTEFTNFGAYNTEFNDNQEVG